MTTHYHRAFSSVGLCGASGPHSLAPTCLYCKVMLLLDDAPTGVLDGLADAIEAEIEARLGTIKPTEPSVAAVAKILLGALDAACANSWSAVPLPPDVETLLAHDYPSPPCRDGSTEACVPGTTDVGRCVYCGRGLL